MLVLLQWNTKAGKLALGFSIQAFIKAVGEHYPHGWVNVAVVADVIDGL